MDLSIVIPFVNEYPMILTTIRSIVEELRGRADFEIIAVDNWCVAVEAQGRKPDRGHKMVHNMASVLPELRTIRFSKRLSHWQAKNVAVQTSKAKFLFFCDAHCIVSRDALYSMLEFYKLNHEKLDGTIHLPLTYHILEEKRLIYNLKWSKERAEAHYTFGRARNGVECYEVPCMSSCGMMMTRELFDYVGGWPEQLGIYGGGENFMNFVLAVLGKKKHIWGYEPLFHHGEKRGYNWNFWDYERNRLIATYLFGGTEFASRFIEKRKTVPNKRRLWKMYYELIPECSSQRELILSRQKITIEEWADKWKGGT
jgi:glycosyltransferase involved in cell wall biosynthesis